MNSFTGIVCEIFPLISYFTQESTLSWEISGFPVIDRKMDHGLQGIDIIPLSSSEEKYFQDMYPYIGKKGALAKDEDSGGGSDEEEDGVAQERSEPSDSSPNHPVLLLCQQSEIGDVFCQRIQIIPRHSPRSAPIQLK